MLFKETARDHSRAVVGKDQTSAKYWKFIKECSKHHLGRPTNHTLKSLKNRWGAIQEMCNPWAGCFEKMKHAPPSGVSIGQYVSKLVICNCHIKHSHQFDHLYVLGWYTHERYQQMAKLNGKSFGLQLCWMATRSGNRGMLRLLPKVKSGVFIYGDERR